MSDPVWLFRKAVRMKRRDSGYVWNHGVFYFWGVVFHAEKTYRPWLSVLLIMGIIHNKKLEMKGLKLFL